MNLPGGGEELVPIDRDEDASLAIDDEAQDSAVGEPDDRSLREDVEALIEDGRTYLEAELVFQKTRAAYVADKAKGAVIFGAVAILLACLALVGLTVGLIIALTPLLTAWGASAVVVVTLVLAAVLCVRMAAKSWGKLMAAIQGPDGGDG
ncbi:hypothetical protein [Altererythrobacter sp. Root672]|uniref:hypothetical protein n=1 Tax=Altererythrobacter sp. Root672 TaxID=1736584 RepID=UPI0006F4117B|nr:hypothetical protein [Altererythrobacter sp. Root672]KRA83403.1 hypothetical protein ASD76_04970 [Altererythrobacter sp. Root672]